jgi:adenosylmethionine-8-amino-7-oxononanoate aminotransferase
MNHADTSLWHPFADMAAVRGDEFVVERGEDVWVWDTAGRRYLDATASLWYANVGHGRREIAQAINDQLSRIEAYSCFADMATPPVLELASTLADRAPMPARVFLTSGGGEAIDTAAKLAIRYWNLEGSPERTVLISRSASYHGTNGYGTSLGGIEANRIGFGPLEDHRVAWDSVAALEQAISTLGPERVAAFFVEPVIGAGGVLPPPDGYIEGVAEVCRRHGVLLIVDSVICGFGRLGSWFGIERWHVTPDMITFAKGVTSGYLPLGGVVIAEHLAEPFWSEPGRVTFRHGPTYSGHATCCAAALANIEILEREGLVERGRAMETALLGALRERLTDHPAVAEIRGGTGMLAAVAPVSELIEADPGAVVKVALEARAGGVLVRPLGAALAVSPPLTATEEHFALTADAIAQGLDSLLAARTTAAP